MFYNYDNLLSRDFLMAFVIGERGVGKSYGAKVAAIKNYKKHNKQFVYLRRYKTELRTSVPNFFDDIVANNEFPDDSFSVNGNKFMMNKKVIGYAIPLSTSNILKSTSYPDVSLIIFDEFIIDKGAYHYLPDEVTKMLDVIETIGRMRDDIKVLFLGNAISVTNPYFNYFKLSLPYNSEFKSFKKGTIIVNYIKNLEYREKKKHTKFGKLIEGTEYGNYAIDNEFLRDSKSFIRKKTKNVRYFCTIIIKGNKYGVWRDYRMQLTFISKSYDPACECVFAFLEDDHNEQTTLINARTSPWMKIVIDSYRKGQLCFESQDIKNITMDIVNKCLTY